MNMENEIETENNGNGHDDKLQKFLDVGSFDGVFTTHQVASAIDKFVERGEKVEDLLLRGYYRDANHINAIVRLYRKAVHFHDTELQALILNHAAGYPGIGGDRINILLKAVVGQLNDQRQRSMGSRLKNALGLNQRNGKDNE